VVAADCCPGKSGQGDSCKQSGKDGLPGKNHPCSACKAGYNCKSPQSYEPTHVVAMMIVPSRPLVTARALSLLSSHRPDGPWRPPRPI
jgi:hypothetical protein